ncbi:MAG TPA: hypothetical protein VIC35_06375 [Acidimicrobiia bacterium]|jgi:hypothetical protein
MTDREDQDHGNLGCNPGDHETSSRDTGYTIDCASCVMHDTAACDDCIVSFIVTREPGDAVVIDVAEERAVRWFQSAGLVPSLRHVSRL